jgi:hypothetical protein
LKITRHTCRIGAEAPPIDRRLPGFEAGQRSPGSVAVDSLVTGVHVAKSGAPREVIDAMLAKYPAYGSPYTLVIAAFSQFPSA